MIHAQASARSVDVDQSVLKTRIGVDTKLRCAIALIVARLGMRLIRYGAHMLSPAHPARHAYGSAVVAWRDRTRLVPWRGFVPTSPRFATVTQTAWLLIAVVLVNTAATLAGMPHAPLFRDLTGHTLPHVILSLSHPRPK